MSDWAPDVAGRLEEIDRRLREIQAELVPGRVPRETRAPVNPSDSDSPPEADAEPSAAPAADPAVARERDAAGETDAPAGEADAAAGDSNEPGDRSRGRSGPLAEALQRARIAHIAGLTSPREPPPGQGVPEQTVPGPPPGQRVPDQTAPEPPPTEPLVAEPPPFDSQGAEASQTAEPPVPESRPEAKPPVPESRPEAEPSAADPPPHEPPPQATPGPPPPQAPPGPPVPPQATPGPPVPPPVQALRRAAARADPRVDVLAELQSSLLTATRDLLDGYERASFTASERRANRVTISAGPFSGTESLHAFEQELSQLPGVRDVDVRGYEGSDRAIIEVELEGSDER